MNALIRKYLSLTAIVILAFALLVVSCQGPMPAPVSAVQSESTPSGEIPAPDDSNLALNQPDQFNWELFAYANQPVSTQVEVGNNQMTNNVLWETWASDPCTFPDKPDPANPPTWDGCADVKELYTSSQLSQAGALPCDETQIDPTDKHSNCEEVHRNQPAFDFIIQNKLWYTEGLAEAFKSDMNVQFPIQAIEVKANWIPLPVGADKEQYHWNYDKDGHVWVLVGMHIMSKAVPNWTWATWEWEGNPGRCDYLGCHDSFGVNPPNVDSNPQPTPQPYSAGKLTPELLSLFQKYGLSPELQHYRLKGSQTNFIDATGRTTLLGNSYTEAGFVQTSSCIGCHGSVATNAQGLTKFSFAAGPPPAPDTLRSYNGVPDPAWFYDPDSGKVTAIPLDFVWAFFNANSLTQSTPTP